MAEAETPGDTGSQPEAGCPCPGDTADQPEDMCPCSADTTDQWEQGRTSDDTAEKCWTEEARVSDNGI